jgi:hypothetical protein
VNCTDLPIEHLTQQRRHVNPSVWPPRTHGTRTPAWNVLSPLEHPREADDVRMSRVANKADARFACAVRPCEGILCGSVVSLPPLVSQNFPL